MRRWQEAGWIPLLILMLVVLGPAELVVGTLLDQSAAEKMNPQVIQMATWTQIKTTVWVLVSIQITIMVATALTLFLARTWSAVKYAIAALWVVGPFWNVASSLIINTAFGLSTYADIFSTGVAFIFASAWTTYLLRSQKVRDFYRGSVPVHQVFE